MMLYVNFCFTLHYVTLSKGMQTVNLALKNPPVLHCRCQSLQIALYSGHITVLVIVNFNFLVHVFYAFVRAVFLSYVLFIDGLAIMISSVLF